MASGTEGSPKSQALSSLLVTDSTVTIVDSQKAEHTVAVTSDTKVTTVGKDATFADVKANDVVAIEAKKGEDNTWTALKISVT